MKHKNNRFMCTFYDFRMRRFVRNKIFNDIVSSLLRMCTIFWDKVISKMRSCQQQYNKKVYIKLMTIKDLTNKTQNLINESIRGVGVAKLQIKNCFLNIYESRNICIRRHMIHEKYLCQLQINK